MKMTLPTSLLASLFLVSACASVDHPADPSDVPDGGGDGGTKSCALVPPRLGDSADAKALAAAPAFCGQPSYHWLADPQLGSVVATGPSESIAAAASQVVLAAGKVQPRGPVHDVNVEQLAYLTQDRGKLLSASALLAYPTDLDAKAAAGKLDVLLVLHGTSGFTDRCAPSSSHDSYALVAGLASLGYVVVAPDYIGLRGLGEPTGFLHPYLAGQPTAMASLDAVRAAARRVAVSGVPGCASTRFVTVGGSQGGHAALWVDRLAPYYAPELQQLGVVATVPPADLLSEGVRALQTAVPASLSLLAFFGASSSWYGAQAKLNEVLVPPLDTQLPATLATTCDPSAQVMGKGLTDIFTRSLLDAAAKPDGLKSLMPWGCMAVENGLTTTSIRRVPPTAPGYGVLYVLGESDTLVNPPIEEKSFDTLCGQGLTMQFLECAGASHTQATTWAMPEIVDFISDRFAGTKPDPALQCKRTPATRCRATP